MLWDYGYRKKNYYFMLKLNICVEKLVVPFLDRDRPPTCCPLHGPRNCHGQKILFPARTGKSPRGLARRPNVPFHCFFTLKLSKIQHKT